jgi:hypothetical protein
MLDGHILTYSIKTLLIYLCGELCWFASYHHVLLLLLFNLLFVFVRLLFHCFIRLFCVQFNFDCLLFTSKILNSDPGLYAGYFDLVII